VLLDRVWATLVGAVIGAAASYLAYPGDPRSRARSALAGLAGAIADLLSEMSAGVAKTPTATETDLWLARSRGLEEELEHVGPQVDEAVAFLRVDPFAERRRPPSCRTPSPRSHTRAQLRAIARTLFDHQIDGARAYREFSPKCWPAPLSPTAPRPSPKGGHPKRGRGPRRRP